jgi:hypothetical protein
MGTEVARNVKLTGCVYARQNVGWVSCGPMELAVAPTPPNPRATQQLVEILAGECWVTQELALAHYLDHQGLLTQPTR